jgi:uncharacterized protein
MMMAVAHEDWLLFAGLATGQLRSIPATNARGVTRVLSFVQMSRRECALRDAPPTGRRTEAADFGASGCDYAIPIGLKICSFVRQRPAGMEEAPMELKDEIVINAPREVVYEALNDPEILKECIPGCEELTKNSDTELEALVVLKIGPVKAKFKGNVTLHPVAPPEHFTLEGQGNGGAAGFAKGGADVTLEEHPEGTLLRYEAKADIGGKLAQLGNRLVQGTAKKLSAKFFSSFAERVGTSA